MSSLFHRWRDIDPGLLKLPSECVPAAGESETLRAKRDAKLKWMRERGVRYLGNPMTFPDRRAPGSAIAPNRNLRGEAERPGDIRGAAERPGDAIVRDLASNG
jgi:hypothetical protein